MATRLRTFHLSVVFIFIAHVYLVAACPTVVSRSNWGAKRTTLQNLKINPPDMVFIHHTTGPVCTNRTICSQRVKGIQDYHINTRNWTDIGYNFLIGGDGAAYEGRGWGKEGAHTPGFNNRSIGIALIGDFSKSSPSTTMQEAAMELIACGVSQGFISTGYTLYGHRQAKDTECPGDEVYKIIKTWSRWSPEWIYETEKCKELDGKCMDNSANCSGHYQSGKCPGPSYVQCCVPCPATPLDIQFLLDESGSIGSFDFQEVKNFVRNYAESFQIGPEETQFGVTTFSDSARNHFWLNSYTNKSSVLQAIDAISYSRGGTNTHLGLDYIRKQAFTAEHGDRPNITNVLIVVTDGQSAEVALTAAAAEKVHQDNIVVLAVGVGGSVNKEELYRIATDNTTVFNVKDFVALHTIHDDLRTRFCEDEVLDDDSFPTWGIIALSVGGSVVVLGAVTATVGVLWVKSKAVVA